MIGSAAVVSASRLRQETLGRAVATPRSCFCQPGGARCRRLNNTLQLAPTRSNFKREVRLKALEPAAIRHNLLPSSVAVSNGKPFQGTLRCSPSGLKLADRCQGVSAFFASCRVFLCLAGKKSSTHHASQRRVPRAQRARLTGDAPDTSSEQPLRRGRSWWPLVQCWCSVGAVVYR